MCRQFQSLILSVAITCTLAAGQQSAARAASNLPQAGRQPLTDRDVIQMVQNGQKEADIVAAIRSTRTEFDLSSQGCKLLAVAHVSRTILNAMGSGSKPTCASISESSKPQTRGAGPLLGNGNTTLLADGSKQTPLTAAAPSSGGDRVALNPQPLPPRTAATAGGGSPGANVAQQTAAVSDYRQPPGAAANASAGSPGATVAQETAAVSDYRPGNKGSSGLKAVSSGRVLLLPGQRLAGPQIPAAATSGKNTTPVGMVKAQTAGSAPLGPGQTLSAQNPSTSPTNSATSIAPLAMNVRPAIAATAHYPGTIEGYVYWESNWGGGWCGYITITVSVEKAPNVYTSLGTLGNISEYVGTVGYKDQLGDVGTVTVCKYVYPNVPIGQDLQVHLDLGLFSLSVHPENPTVGPIKIPKISTIKCGMSSPNVALAQPSLSQKDLNSPWEICRSSAYKVNFANDPIVWIPN